MVVFIEASGFCVLRIKVRGYRELIDRLFLIRSG
jgi:hypothetical protein